VPQVEQSQINIWLWNKSYVRSRYSFNDQQ